LILTGPAKKELVGSEVKAGARVPALVIGLPETGETKMLGIVRPTLVTPPDGGFALIAATVAAETVFLATPRAAAFN